MEVKSDLALQQILLESFTFILRAADKMRTPEVNSSKFTDISAYM